MTTFQVNYSVEGFNSKKDFEAADLKEAYRKTVKILHDVEITTQPLAVSAVTVKNLETGEAFVPNTGESKLIPASESFPIE
jgi:hypothetical protein